MSSLPLVSPKNSSVTAADSVLRKKKKGSNIARGTFTDVNKTTKQTQTDGNKI